MSIDMLFEISELKLVKRKRKRKSGTVVVVVWGKGAQLVSSAVASVCTRSGYFRRKLRARQK